VERNAKIGDDEEARKRDIPIVQVSNLPETVGGFCLL
jgi:hypothetical protein